MSEVTRILSAIEQGDPHAAEQLLPLVYDELRKLAAERMAQEKPGQTLEPTALVHEAYLRLVGDQQFVNRGHIFAAAAEAMRRILIERARQRAALKYGGQRQRVPLSDYADSDVDERLMHLDEALTRLAVHDPVAAKVVELHHFAGYTQADAALALGISEYQVRRKWTFARAWLKTTLTD